MNDDTYLKLKKEMKQEMNKMQVVLDDKINTIHADLNSGIQQIIRAMSDVNNKSDVNKHEMMELKQSVAKMNKLQALSNDMAQIGIKNTNKKDEETTKEFGEIGDKLDEIINHISSFD